MKKITKKTSAPKPTSTTTATSVSQVADTSKAPPAPLAPVVASPMPVKAAPIIASVPSLGPAKAAPPQTPVVTAAAPVTIEAKIDIGFGNNLFARGQGGGLSWEHGIPLECVDSKTWRLIVPAKDQLQFKLLLNDAVWCKGEDLVATPGKKVEVTPAF